MQQYQIASSTAEDEIRQGGFEVISRDDRFSRLLSDQATGRLIMFGG
jgi:hypothetical protein